MIPEKEELKFGRRNNEDKCQPVVQSDAAFKNGFGQTSDSDTRVSVWFTPYRENLVHSLTNFRSVAWTADANLLQQFVSQFYLQRGLRCLQ